jgi:hypothetical protein
MVVFIRKAKSCKCKDTVYTQTLHLMLHARVMEARPHDFLPGINRNPAGTGYLLYNLTSKYHM